MAVLLSSSYLGEASCGNDINMEEGRGILGWLVSGTLKLTASLHLKIDGWKMNFPFGMAYFWGLC